MMSRRSLLRWNRPWTENCFGAVNQRPKIPSMHMLSVSSKCKWPGPCGPGHLSKEVSLFRLFRPHRGRGSLNEGLDLDDIRIRQLAGKVRHALVHEGPLEDDVLQIGNG